MGGTRQLKEVPVWQALLGVGMPFAALTRNLGRPDLPRHIRRQGQQGRRRQPEGRPRAFHRRGRPQGTLLVWDDTHHPFLPCVRGSVAFRVAL